MSIPYKIETFKKEEVFKGVLPIKDNSSLTKTVMALRLHIKELQCYYDLPSSGACCFLHKGKSLTIIY